MERIKKVGIGVGSLIGVLLFIGAIVFFIYMLLSSVGALEHYLRVYEHPLMVDAVVTSHDSYDDDGGTDYRSYVTYTANGKEYRNIKYEDKDNKGSLTPKGTRVSLQVSPEDPSQSIAYLKGGSGVLGFCALVLALLLAWIWNVIVHLRRSDDLLHTPDRETIERDMKLTIKGRFGLAFWLVMAVGVVVLWHRYAIVLGQWLIYVALASGGLWVNSLISARRDLAVVDAQGYELRRDKLVRKEINDNDDSTTYELYYSSGEKNWKTTTNAQYYKKAVVGEEVLAVFLPGKKKPLLHYNTEGDAC